MLTVSGSGSQLSPQEGKNTSKNLGAKEEAMGVLLITERLPIAEKLLVTKS